MTLQNNQPLIASEMHKMSILSEHSTVNISDCSYMFIDQCKISRWEAPHQKYTRNTFYIVAAKGRKCSFFVQPAAKKEGNFSRHTSHTRFSKLPQHSNNLHIGLTVGAVAACLHPLAMTRPNIEMCVKMIQVCATGYFGDTMLTLTL